MIGQYCSARGPYPEQARVWLEKHFPPQKHTEVFRDTSGSLFSTAVRLAKENGHFEQKIQDCLDKLEKQSQQAHAAIHFSYVPLSELYDLNASCLCVAGHRCHRQDAV